MSGASPFSALGAPATPQRHSDPDASILESFPNPHPGDPWVVGMRCEEFTSLCPVTGQPDFGRILVHYVPGPACVESKSLKLYLGAYRGHGAFHEACVNRVADDLQEVLAPRLLRVLGDFNLRGGIAIVPLALRSAPDLTPHERSVCLELLAQHDSVVRGGAGWRPGH